MTWAEAPGAAQGVGAGADRIMHARMTSGNALVMASDAMFGREFVEGKNFALSLECDSLEKKNACLLPSAQAGK